MKFRLDVRVDGVVEVHPVFETATPGTPLLILIDNLPERDTLLGNHLAENQLHSGRVYGSKVWIIYREGHTLDILQGIWLKGTHRVPRGIYNVTYSFCCSRA